MLIHSERGSGFHMRLGPMRASDDPAIKTENSENRTARADQGFAIKFQLSVERM